jgi:hypothetical protein
MRREERSPTAPGRQVLRWLLPLLIALGVYGTWLAKVRPVLTGDEPCYLVQAYSLTQDRDLDLSNNFDNRDRRGVIRFTGQLQPGSCAEEFRDGGRLRPRFNPGVPLLLAPAALVVPRSLPLLRIPMVLVAAVWAQQMYLLLRDVARRRGAAELVWVATAFLLPAIGYSNQLYPEVPAALCATVAVRCLLRADRSWRWSLGAAAAVAPLPWFHVRFGLIAAVLVLFAAVAGRGRPERGRRLEWTTELVRRRWFVPLPFLASVAALGGMYVAFYGTPSPSAPYSGGTGAPLAQLDALQSYRIGVGTLLGTSSGVLPVNPFLWVGLAGLGCLMARWRVVGTILVATLLVQLFVINPLGFFAYTLPGRFAVVLLPLLAVGALLAIEASRPIALVSGGLALVALVPLISGWRDYGKLYDLNRVQTPLARRTKVVWPPVENVPGLDQAGYRTSAAVREVGRVGPMPGGGDGVLTSPADGPGLVAWGPDVELRSGSYNLAVGVAGSGPAAAPAGLITVRATASGTILAERSFVWAEVATTPTRPEAGIELSFFAPTETIRFEVESRGTGELAVSTIAARPLGSLVPPATPVRRGVPLALLWFGTTGLVAALLAERRSAQGRSAAVTFETSTDSRSEPVLPLEVPVADEGGDDHQAQGPGVAVLPAELGHVVEVHAVDAGDERGRDQDRSP